jgi:hypothetical protein
MLATNKIFPRKTKKGTVSLIVREHYIREDLPCFVEGMNSKKYDIYIYYILFSSKFALVGSERATVVGVLE